MQAEVVSGVGTMRTNSMVLDKRYRTMQARGGDEDTLSWMNLLACMDVYVYSRWVEWRQPVLFMQHQLHTHVTSTCLTAQRALPFSLTAREKAAYAKNLCPEGCGVHHTSPLCRRCLPPCQSPTLGSGVTHLGMKASSTLPYVWNRVYRSSLVVCQDRLPTAETEKCETDVQ
jgi:hypothetical protein